MNAFFQKLFIFFILHWSTVLFSQLMWCLCCFHLSASWISQSANSTLTSLATATPACIWPSTTPIPNLGRSHCLPFLLLVWQVLLTVSLQWTPSLLTTDAFIHPLTIIWAPPAALNLLPTRQSLMYCSFPDVSSATLQNELNLFCINTHLPCISPQAPL